MKILLTSKRWLCLSHKYPANQDLARNKRSSLRRKKFPVVDFRLRWLYSQRPVGRQRGFASFTRFVETIFNLIFDSIFGTDTSMGEIGKWRQLNETEQYGAVWDHSFYEMRCILKFMFKNHLMNEIEIFLIWLKQD